MKHIVNFYHPEFHPQLRLLTLTSVIMSWVFAALICSFFYFYVSSEQQSIKSEISTLEQKHQQQKILVKELRSAIDNQKVDPILFEQVEKNQRIISLKKRVLNKLTSQEALRTHGFSKLMIDLANHNQSGLWLTHINLNGMSVVMEGAATDSAVVPKWLSSLGQTDYFRGQEFSKTRLYRNSKQQLNFVISTGEEPSLAKNSNND
ncbi:MAG: Tfp pilus assembly protein PilN [Paraglaciecola sp.]|jgi:Tfp pilus assembly protein PilN